MLKIFNTLTQKKEVFKPLDKKGKVGLYTCGPTVYWFCHIGNLRTYIFEDILKRVLQYNGYKVNQVMNITDVGHLTSDADTGEDKLEKGAKREKKTVWQIADFYTKEFKNDFKLLNILAPQKWIKATDTIKGQIEFIKKLEKKGFTYNISDGVYFDTSKLKNYGRLWSKKTRAIKPGARVDIVPGKKNPTDFALWKLTPANVKRQMEWQSPWGRGFPGWHTECVVMASQALGVPFDIHCGGIDHIFIHHTNEISQSEALFGKVLAKYWLHAEFLVLKQGRMGKSEGNIIILKDIAAKKINPLAFRYLCLTSHYKSKLTFSWKSLKASQNALGKLYEKISKLRTQRTQDKGKAQKYKKEFLNYINDDLDTPKALALVWKLIKTGKASYDLLLDFDKVFGLSFGKVQKTSIPNKIKELTALREKYRKQKNWPEADKIRKKIKTLGFTIEDTSSGPTIKKIKGA